MRDKQAAIFRAMPGEHLVYGLLDYIVDGHFDTVQSLGDAIEALEDHLFSPIPLDRKVQRRSFELRKEPGAAAPGGPAHATTCCVPQNGPRACGTWSRRFWRRT